MEAYVVPDWLKIIAGLVIYRFEPKQQVLLGLRSARAEEGKWCLPTGLGAIRRDISSVLAVLAPGSLKEPLEAIKAMSERHQQAFKAPAGFALAEAKWYLQIPSAFTVEHLKPLKPIAQLDNKSLLVKIYFGLEWKVDELPKPAETEWPFAEVKFFAREELKGIPIAFGCDEDLEDVFWPWLKTAS